MTTLGIVWETYKIPPWWAYVILLGFILFGRYNLLLWRKSIDPNATPWKRATTEKNYRTIGMWITIAGISNYAIYMYLICKNWQITPLWFYFLSSGLILGGICLIIIWKRSISSPPSLSWDNILKDYYFIFGITTIVWGGAGLFFGIK
jgi:hypothetical protein